MKRVLITGGAGYIGNVLATLLIENGLSVKAVDLLWFDKKIPDINKNNPRYKFIKGDISDNDILDEAIEGVDYVVHTAAVVGDPASKKFPDLTYKTNVQASMGIIKKAEQKKIKGFIFLSTCSNYGITDGAADEDTPLKPLSLYSETKVKIEEFLMSKTKDLDWVICRLSTVYGLSPRMRFDLTVNDFALNAFKKKYLDIFLPYSYRPYIHVYDAAKTISKIIDNFDKVKNNVFNVGFPKENYQKIEIANIVKEYIPGIKIDILKDGADKRDYKVDFSKIEKSLGVNKTYTVRDGIREIIHKLEKGDMRDPYEAKYYNTSPDIEAGA